MSICVTMASILFSLDKDNEYLTAISQGLTRICYGMEGGEGLYISGKLGACAPFLSFEWEHEGQKFEVNTHLIGSYNMKNALAAIYGGPVLQCTVPADL